MWQYKKENSKLSMTDWPCHVWLQKIVWHTNKAVLGGGGGGVVTCFYAPFWVMELSVLYHQTIIFTKENGVYQQWKICPLKSKKVGNAFSRDLGNQTLNSWLNKQ